MGAVARATGHWLSGEPPGGLLINPMAYCALDDSRAWHSQAPGNALDFLEYKLVERQLDLACGPVQPVSWVMERKELYPNFGVTARLDHTRSSGASLKAPSSSWRDPMPSLR